MREWYFGPDDRAVRRFHCFLRGAFKHSIVECTFLTESPVVKEIKKRIKYKPTEWKLKTEA